MLRLAPTLSAAVLLAAMLAAAVPAGAAMMLKLVTMKNPVAVGLSDPATKQLAGDTGGLAKATAARAARTL